MNQLLTPRHHPLYAALREFKIPLWQVSLYLGGSPSETALSRMLRNIQPLPVDVEEKITNLVESEKGEKK